MWGIRNIEYPYGLDKFKRYCGMVLKKFSKYDIYLIDEFNDLFQSSSIKSKTSTGEKNINLDAILNLFQN